MVGILVARMATGCRAEAGDLYAATLMAQAGRRPNPMGERCIL